ncbi:uncharacterized protein ARMOST_02368 [Armillaria ostoyae]|uniref:Uncharacterized protein n=1 Tax=Armillaria ostoyae TaxID=47428 RepID=A0A284QRP8_ARMOS|nr:uncharacterized protein ARMOST_02368 [Armillaria ostoyae]
MPEHTSEDVDEACFRNILSAQNTLDEKSKGRRMAIYMTVHILDDEETPPYTLGNSRVAYLSAAVHVQNTPRCWGGRR